MKKFISLALTAAMVASLVPATAFAAKTKDGDTYNGTVSVVNAWNNNKDFNGNVNKSTGKDVPEVQIRVGDVNYQGTDAGKTARFTVRLDNANFFTKDEVDAIKAGNTSILDRFNDGIRVRLNPNGVVGDAPVSGTAEYSYAQLSDTEINTILGDLYENLANGATWTDPADTYAIETADVTAVAAAKTQIATNTIGTGKVVVTKAWLGTNAGADAASLASDPNYKSADDVLTKIVTAYNKNSTLDGLTYTTNLGAPYNEAGWYKVAASGIMDKAVPYSTVRAKVMANKDDNDAPATYTETVGSVTIDYKDGMGANGFVAIGSADNKTKPVWVAERKAALDTYLSTTATGTPCALYKENVNMAGSRPAYGLARTGIVASVKTANDVRRNEIIVTVENPANNSFLEKGDIISVDLTSVLENASKDAGVSVTSSDFTLTNDNADFTYVNVDKEALQLSIRKVVDVAEDEVVTLDDKGLKIAANVGYFKSGEANKIRLKVSGGFEFVPRSINNNDGGKDFEIVAKNDGENVPNGAEIVDGVDVTKEEILVTVNDDKVNEITIYGIDIKAASAKIDKVATIKATSPGFSSSSAVEVAKVVDYIVNLTVDEDEDVPVIYSGVNSDNYGLTDDSDHWSLEVTAKESFPGAWSFRKGFNFELPDHVFVTDVEVVSTENLLLSKENATNKAEEVKDDDVFVAFFNAYQNGSHVNFEFDKRVFDDVDAKLTDDPAEMTFKLQLVADTGFEGDVPLKLTGELVEEQEVTIAKFVKPFEVKAEQNDIIIDYRYTDIPTAITITEAEAGLWDADKAEFRFALENQEKNFFEFEGDPTFTVDSNSGMELKSAEVIGGTNNPNSGKIHFFVDNESDDAAATIEITDMQLFMNRSIPAGPYDLTIESTLQDAYLAETLFAPDGIESITDEADYRAQLNTFVRKADDDNVVDDVDDVMDTVKEAFINVVTAGRDVDDASFTTKVVVPVGENYIVAGEKQIELDTPAYINASGYTMLPIRAVATALGINNNNVLWDQPTKTVTILYGQRIITMTQGQKVVYVNGSAIPASAAVENTNSRTFLPMRDLATALGVTDIEWNQATRTATLNGNQKGNQ